MDTERTSPANVVAAIPSALAVGVAAIYGLGAITEIENLHGAGVAYQDALTLFPVQQLLSIGVSTSGFIFGVILIAAGSTAAVVGSAKLEELALRPHGQSFQTPRWKKMKLRSFIVLSVVLSALIGPIAVAGFIAALPANFVATYDQPQLSKVFGRTLVSAAVAVLVLFWFWPARLPDVSVRMLTGKVTTGKLVANAGGTWYIGNPNHSILAIPSASAVSVTITHRSGFRPPIPIVDLFRAL